MRGFVLLVALYEEELFLSPLTSVAKFFFVFSLRSSRDSCPTSLLASAVNLVSNLFLFAFDFSVYPCQTIRVAGAYIPVHWFVWRSRPMIVSFLCDFPWLIISIFFPLCPL